MCVVLKHQIYKPIRPKGEDISETILSAQYSENKIIYYYHLIDRTF